MPIKASSSSSTYSPRKYESDGAFSIEGLGLTVLVGVVCALIVGVIGGFVSQYFYLAFLFPVVMGMVVGGTQVLIISKFKIRHPLACGVSGLLAAVFCVLAMHHVEYHYFTQALAEDEAKIALLRGNWNDIDADLKAEMAAAIARYENNPEVIAAQQVNSFVGYMDFTAKMGVELGSAKHATDKPINLGYVGSFVYWAFEALIVAGCCWLLTRARASEPFCNLCESWMKETEITSLACRDASVVHFVESGRLKDLLTLESASSETAISVCTCGCDAPSEVVIQVSEVFYHQGTRGKRNKGRFVYPVTVVNELREMFSRDAVNVDSVATGEAKERQLAGVGSE